MPNIHFGERDNDSVDLEPSVPEETLVDLLCMTRDATQGMVTQLNTMAANVADMKQVLAEHLPELTRQLQDTRAAIEAKTNEGVGQSQRVISALENLHRALECEQASSDESR